jgi:hypothetical protein
MSMDFGLLSEDVAVTALADGSLHPDVLAHHCVDWSVGPLRVHACVDLSKPEADITVYLLGVKIAQAKLDRGRLCANLGGSVDGFKAKAKVCLALNPIRITVDAEICVPILGCKKYHHEFHLSHHQAMDEAETTTMWASA